MPTPVSLKPRTGAWRPVNTRFGTFLVACVDGVIVHSALPNAPRVEFLAGLRTQHPGVAFVERQSEPVLEEAARQLVDWADGKRKEFDVPLATVGTPFQRRVWGALAEIPYGQVRSYVEVAASIGKPRASRAVGQANNRNPVAPFIPCHRVVAASGGLGGYGGGLQLKARMLALEGVVLED